MSPRYKDETDSYGETNGYQKMQDYSGYRLVSDETNRLQYALAIRAKRLVPSETMRYQQMHEYPVYRLVSDETNRFQNALAIRAKGLDPW